MEAEGRESVGGGGDGGNRAAEGGAEVEDLELQNRQRAAAKPMALQFVLKLLVLWFSFSFFSKQWGITRTRESLKDIEQTERALEEQDLSSRMPKKSELSPIKQLAGLQSAEIPIFPEFDAAGRRLAVHRCLFRPGQRMDLFLYFSETDSFASFADKEALVWEQHGLTLDKAATNSRQLELTLPASPALQNNGSMFAHAFLAMEGAAIDPSDARYKATRVANLTVPLVKYKKERPKKKLKSLLTTAAEPESEPDTQAHGVDKGGGEGGSTAAERVILTQEEQEEEEEDVQQQAREGGVIRSYWKPTLHLQLVQMTDVFQRNAIPAPLGGYIHFQESTGNYFPVLHVDEFWMQANQLVALNDSVETVALEVTFNTVGMVKWMLKTRMEAQWAQQEALGLNDEGDDDMIREMIASNSPWVLILTALVSMLHSLFNFLAFKNDVSFWNDKRSLEGLSIRGMAVGFFFQMVIFLYLLDNDTSRLVLVTNGIGVAIEFWKIGKAFKTSFVWSDDSWMPRLEMEARGGYEKNMTKEYDRIGTLHLLYLVVPLVVGYSAYSLVHKQHKGWYSWVINSLVGYVYAFSFVMMTPQLFINYKLQSVAHMPWRVMVYKSLNTFIDDIFAFIIKMPTMHRLACFRDDFIFFLFLYQRYIYPVDRTRINQYGQRGDGVPPPPEGKEGEEAKHQLLEGEGTATRASGEPRQPKRNKLGVKLQ